jgi:hypothetical protein
MRGSAPRASAARCTNPRDELAITLTDLIGEFPDDIHLNRLIPDPR